MSVPCTQCIRASATVLYVVADLTKEELQDYLDDIGIDPRHTKRSSSRYDSKQLDLSVLTPMTRIVTLQLLFCARRSHLLGDVTVDDRSCGSSRMSAKSEKNMADFEDENVLSDDDEIAQLTSTPHCAGVTSHGKSSMRNISNVITEEFNANNSES